MTERPSLRPGGLFDPAAFDNVDGTEDPARFAELLDLAAATDNVRELKNQVTKRLAARPGDRILDVGCGTGDDALRWAQLVGPDGGVIGVDRSNELLRVARDRLAGTSLPAEFRHGDAADLAFPGGVFDAVTASRVLIHTPDPARALAEFARVTRPGGRVVVFDVDANALLFDAPDVRLTQKLVGLLGDSLRSGRIGRRLPALFTAAGLSVRSVEPCGVLLPYELCRTLLTALLSQAAENTGLTARDIARWWDSLDAAACRGEFFAVWYGLIVCGTKPTDTRAAPPATANNEPAATQPLEEDM
jgi:ubiquinone/menaquinone biosynthesis C-methylase UbiE